MRAWSFFVALVLVLPSLACAPSSPAPAAPKAGAAAGAKATSGSSRAATPVSGAAGALESADPATRPQEAAEVYTYQAAGRRDPFTNLLNRGIGVDPREVINRGEGTAGLAVNEIVVRGLVQINGRLVAMIQGPDGRTYNIHQGDKLADGTVKSVTREGLVIVQEVNDPLSTAKEREVRKLLRSLEEGKQ
jgi:Tfp pilus assembly protein PilP